MTHLSQPFDTLPQRTTILPEWKHNVYREWCEPRSTNGRKQNACSMKFTQSYRMSCRTMTGAYFSNGVSCHFTLGGSIMPTRIRAQHVPFSSNWVHRSTASGRRACWRKLMNSGLGASPPRSPISRPAAYVHVTAVVFVTDDQRWDAAHTALPGTRPPPGSA